MIGLKNIDVIKPGMKFLSNFSWNIQASENWVITGPNGSGKTILLETLAGLSHVSKGEIHYDFIAGETWEERYAERRKFITYIPVHALHNFLSANQNMYYQQRYYDIGDQEIASVRNVLGDHGERLKELKIPANLSIEHLMDVEVTRLSNGQLKKLLLLRNFLKGMPRLLLLDYPFEGLDYESREELCHFIDFIAAQYHVQVIIVDHHHHLPACINRRITLRDFKIEKPEKFIPPVFEAVILDSAFPSEQHTNGEEVIRMDNLQLKYGDHMLFDNFNWKVNKGQRWALVGRNGSGKTTLFSLIFADHPQAYAQKVYVFGKRRGSGESIWDIKRRINYMGPEQISYLNPKSVMYTGREYIRSINRKLKEEVLEDLIVYFKATVFIDKPVRILSSGELQLLMIMNCFLSDKELLLLDEPFQFLDDSQKARLNHYLLTHLNAETTLILITHYKHDVRQWTDMKMEI
jgi:molybdate transport system ATP-binding protein